MTLSTLKQPNKKAKILLSSEATYATTLLVLALDRLGPEMLHWHQMTRRLELEEEIGAEMPPINGDKLSAAVDILTSDAFFQRVPVFIQYCNILSGSRFVVGTFDPADADECAWGITEALLISPPEEDEPFSEEILWYIGKVLDEEGIKTPPDVLRIARRASPADFSEMSTQEPSMFQAEFKFQEDEAKEIEQMVRTKLIELLHELEQLPLKNGDTSNLTSRIAKGLLS